MAKFFLHYGPHTFDLADAEAAVEVRDKISWARANNAGVGRLRARTADGIVLFHLSASIPLAISATGAGADAIDEEAARGGDPDVY